MSDAARRRGARRRAFLVAALVALAVVAAIVQPATVGGPSHRHGSPSPAPSPVSLGPPSQVPPTTEEFGANVNWLYNGQFSGNGYTSRQIGEQLQALRQTGATIARTNALWAAVEPSPPTNGVHHYDWSVDDQIAGSLAAHGLRWFAIVDYSPGWTASVPGQASAPRSQSAYAAFAAALAARYGAGGAFWRDHPDLPPEPIETYEIWNEPDSGQFWPPAPDAAQYVDLYLRARDAITAVDPTARVIVGGLTNPSAFIPAMLRARPALAGHVDGVGIHPYGVNPNAVLLRVRGARQVLAAAGMSGVPLYVTEFGWVSRPRGGFMWLPARLRPEYISSTIAALGHTNCAVAATLLYTWVLPRRNVVVHPDWYGIHPSGGSAESSAFAAGLRNAGQPGPVAPLCGFG